MHRFVEYLTYESSNHWAVSLSNLAEISSGPVALPTSSALSATRTVDSLRVRSDTTVSERMHVVFSTALSIVNTEAKNLLNRSAIPADVSALTLEGFCDWSAEKSETVVTETWHYFGCFLSATQDNFFAIFSSTTNELKAQIYHLHKPEDPLKWKKISLNFLNRTWTTPP